MAFAKVVTTMVVSDPTLRRPLARSGAALAAAILLGLSCGGDEGTNPVTPPTPTAPPRQLTGMTIVAARTDIRVGQVLAPLVAYGEYDDGTTGTLAVQWASSDPTVVRIADDGTVTGIAAGSAEISAVFEGFSAVLVFEVDEPDERSTEDRPDDRDGPQIHVVYALPSDVEDGNLDRYGYIARSFEAIQKWVAAELGYRFRLDTHGGELDVTYLRLPFTHQEGDGQSGSLVFAIEQAIARSVGIHPDKIYAVYYAGRSAGVCGSAPLSGRVGAVYVHPEGCSNSTPGMDENEASTYEAVMVHELFHVFGAVPSCSPNNGAGAHVVDDPVDVMYAGVERGARADAVIDVARDDYFGHGRADCLDIAENPYWERVGGLVGGVRQELPRVSIPAADWPIRCEVHN